MHRACGINHMGENRVQQLTEHFSDYEKGDLRLHFIGTLQTNKVKYIIDKVDMIESVDSLKLAAEIDRQAKKHGIVMDVLIEINSGREENKNGVLPEDAEALCLSLKQYSGIHLCGFMTMAPACETAEAYRVYFDEVAQLSHALWHTLGYEGKPVLSMGMSESFEPAIASGATSVRVGRKLFEK